MFFLYDLLIRPIVHSLIRIARHGSRLKNRDVQSQIQAFAKTNMPQALAKLRAQLLSFLFILSSEQYREFIAAHTADQTVGGSIFINT